MVQVSAQSFPRANKKKSVVVEPAEGNVGSAVADALRKRAKSFATNFQLCQQKYSEKSIHDLRVSLRRINAILTILSSVLNVQKAKKLKKKLSKLLKGFSDLRDLQVQILSVSSLLPHFGKLEKFQNHLLERERKMIKRISKDMRKSSVDAELKVLKALSGDLDRPSHDISGQKKLKAQLYNHVESRFARVMVLTQMVDPEKIETIHRVRLAFKKYRYAVEALNNIFSFSKSTLKEMHDFQTIMGEIHDLDVLQGTIDEFLQGNERQARVMSPVLEKIAQTEKKQINRFLRQAKMLDKFRIIL
ncbi:MAG: CHAD domain-containing protein [Deltaproteobacteria bacterium]|nr:CHAD domain-containing protein [Deltaproteobacteria bacterium]